MLVVHGLKRPLKTVFVFSYTIFIMCSFNACKYNYACKAIYDRLVAKGKSKKLALIAVCNKLLKQAFAIAKSGLIYDNNYRSTLVKS